MLFKECDIKFDVWERIERDEPVDSTDGPEMIYLNYFYKNTAGDQKLIQDVCSVINNPGLTNRLAHNDKQSTGDQESDTGGSQLGSVNVM